MSTINDLCTSNAQVFIGELAAMEDEEDEKAMVAAAATLRAEMSSSQSPPAVESKRSRSE